MTSYTRAQYEKLGLNGPWTGPFALENRGPPDQGGTGAYYAKRQGPILGICLHITAGINDYDGNDSSAEATNNYGRTATGASWTGIVDSDSIINCLHPDRVAWVQGVPGYNFNTPLVGLEIGKRTPDWNDAPDWWVEATLRNAAAYCAPFVLRYKIPLELVTDRDEVQRRINRGQPVGFTYHWRLTPDTRSDPGRHAGRDTFPWVRFLGYLREAVARLTGGTVKPAPAPPPRVGTWPAGWIANAQRLLNDLGYTDAQGKPLAVDDSLGPATQHATRTYQTDAGLDPDGRPDAATTTSLEDTMSKIDTLLAEIKKRPTLGQIMSFRHSRPEYAGRDVHGHLRDATTGLAATLRVEAALAEANGHQVDTKALAEAMRPILEDAVHAAVGEGSADAIVDELAKRLADKGDAA